MKRLNTEALIIGSGFGAAAPALRLAEAGIQVTMIEKGPGIDPVRDYKQTQDPKHYLKFLKSTSGDAVSFTYTEAYGGGSGYYEMVSLRAPSAAFEQTESGRRIWPGKLTRSDLDPHYEEAERMLHITQIPREDVPKSGAVFSYMLNRLGYSCDRARYAAVDCIGGSYCISGCIFGAKQTLMKNYLPAAERAGMQVITSTEAVLVRKLTGTAPVSDTRIPPRYEVVCKNTGTGEVTLVRAGVVVFGGGTIGTAALLMRSKQQLPSLSRQLGKNVTFNGSVKSAALLPDDFPEGDMYTGRSHPGMISYAFLKSHGITISSAKPLPLDVIATARLVRKGREQSNDYWGSEHVKLMKRYRRRAIIMYALGLTTHTAELRYDGDGKVTPHLELSDGLRSYASKVTEVLQSIYKRNGCTILNPQFVDGEGKAYEDLHFSSAHMMGSCRMAESPEQGVVDSNGEVFGYPGLYVTDGAAIPSSLAVNSSLTILANAERIGKHLAEVYGRVHETLPLHVHALSAL